MPRLRGFVLMPLLVLITLLAAVVLLLNVDSVAGLADGSAEAETAAAWYVAEAGIQHGIWQARNSDCGSYSDLSEQPFGAHKYSVTVMPKSGSPIYLHSDAELAGGARGEAHASAVPVYSMSTFTTVVLQPGPEGKDAYIRDSDKNHGISPILQVKDKANALLKFALSDLPESAIVTDARLALYMEDGNDFDDAVFSAHRLSRDWVEGTFDDDKPPPGGGATYETYDGNNPWTTKGGDYDAAPIASIYVPANNLGWKEWVVTDQVQAWQAGQANYGFLLRFDRDSSDNSANVDFTSSDGDVGNAPRLTITYVGCECGTYCDVQVTEELCDADFEALLRNFEFDWDPSSRDYTGIDFLPEGIVVNGVTIPAGGGWIAADSGEDKFFVSDAAGNALTSFPAGQSDVRGVTYVSGGAWINFLAFADKGDDAIYLMDLDGIIQASITTGFIAEEPFGLGFIGETAGNSYDNHLAFTSKKNGAGEIYIIDQSGALKKTIDVDAFAANPQGVSHLAGFDKLMVTDKSGIVSVVDFDGVLLNQYDGATWGLSDLRGTSIHPQTCEHVLLDANFETVSGVVPYRSDLVIGPEILFIVADKDDLTDSESAAAATMESWGYSITPLSDEAGGAAYDAAVAASDAVLIGAGASPSEVGSKLVGAPIGLVSELAGLADELGFSTGISSGSGTTLDIDDISHSITAPFALGSLSVLNGPAGLSSLSGSLAPGLRVLASTGAGSMLATLELGAEQHDSTQSAGRRAYLPWGNGFQHGNLSDAGETLFRRALDWSVQPPPRCDADFAANRIVSEFDWMPASGAIQGIDYVPEGLVVNGVSVPAGGGWVMADNNQDRLFVTDLAGNTLTDFAIFPPDAQGVALVDAGPWFNHFAIVDKNKKRLLYANLDGSILSSVSLAFTIPDALGLGYIGSTAGGLYDGHLAISSDKDLAGGGTATIFIIDQWGSVEHTVDIEAFAPTPLGVTHVEGADKFIVADKSGVVSVVSFNGDLLRQYSAASLGITEVNEIAINPMTCEHALVEKKLFEKIKTLDRDDGAGKSRYFEMQFAFQATAEDMWQPINLDIYGIPAGAVAEVLVVNADGGKELWGGVRTSGSLLDRRLQLHEGAGGVDVMVMHVEVGPDGFIEYFADDFNKLSFVILGYWTNVGYEERWQSFQAGASNSWQDHALSPYGVTASSVAEILMVNNAGFNEREAGARPDGSGLSRLIKLHEALDGGDETMSMMAEAGADPGATIEVFASSDADVEFYLLGHWSSPPGIYVSAFTSLGSATVSKAWESADLSGNGVPAGAVVQLAAVNRDFTGGAKMGARSVGSPFEPLVDLHKPLNGGEEAATLHVTANADSKIEWYDENVLDDHRFYLLGWWVLGP